MKPPITYPIYVISKGRADCCLTAKFLIRDGVDFRIVIEPQEEEAYAKNFGKDRLYILPFANLGLGGIPARNWVWEHAKASGAKRHWILDDNICWVYRRFKTRRFHCNSRYGFAAVEEFTDRYENIGISGMNYGMFVPDRQKIKPFFLNVHVYSDLLILNDLPYRWRGRYNEDTDLCLQVLSGNWCTVLFNAFSVQKMATMKMKGGNTAELYKGDGRLKMARSLERVWPGIVTVDRRFKRPQHIIKDSWRDFDTPLIRRKDIDFSKLKTNDYGMKLVQVGKEVKDPDLRKELKEYEKKK